ncbi:MAG TPA: cytochrome P450 [Mycobacterium sp.]|nr:cytochrome P450 [Mycobacterium sp.]
MGFGQPSPHSLYAELRTEAPVHPGAPHLGAPGNHDGTPTTFSVYGYDAAVEVLLDTGTFSSSAHADLAGTVMGRSVIEMDPPEHRSYRALLQPSLGPKTMARWQKSVVTPLLEEMITNLRPAGRDNLVRGFLFDFPMRTFAAMLGLPKSQYAEFHYAAIELITLVADPVKGKASAGALGDMFATVLTDRRIAPRDDLISVLAHAEHDGQRLTDEEIYSFLRLLLPAGAETTYRSSSTLLAALFANPDQLELVRDDPAALTAAVNEVNRWETPLQFVPRRATRDTEVAGVAIPRGSTVVVVLGAANRDPSRWENPDRFDLRRPHRPAIAFGHGAHLCIGKHLSNLETESLVHALLELPNVRLNPDAETPTIEGTLMRSPSRLEVVWDV